MIWNGHGFSPLNLTGAPSSSGPSQQQFIGRFDFSHWHALYVPHPDLH